MSDRKHLTEMITPSINTAQEVFNKYTAFTENIALYVPSTMYNEQVDNTEYVNEVIKRMSLIFGGATAYYADGGYVADSGELITENIRIVKSCTGIVTAENAREVIKIAEWLKSEMQQECISVEYNGKLMFV